MLGGPGDRPLFTNVATPTIARAAILNESLALGNCDNDGDGTLNALDLQPFVMALLDPTAYAESYPDCDPANADLNGDAQLDDADAKQFVHCLLNETCPS